MGRPIGALALGFAALLGAASAEPLAGQWAPPARFESARVPPVVDHGRDGPNVSREGVAEVALVGLLGAGAGFMGGALAGYSVELAVIARSSRYSGGDDPGVIGAVIGAFAGPALVTPFVVHRANGRRGSLIWAYASATVIGAAGIAALLPAGRDYWLYVLFGVPVAQAVSATLIETLTTSGAHDG